MLLKESKIRALENFYALDYVFYGKSINEVETCCPLVKEEYLSIKGALLSVFIEMIKLVDHSPERIEERVDSKLLIKNAKYSATHARENAQRIVSSDKSRKNIKESMKEELKNDKSLDITKVVEQKIREKAFSLAVDNLLLARVVSESKKFDALNKWEGRLIEDSYKILRDNLVEAAYQVLYPDEVLGENETIEEVVPLVPIAIGAAVGGAIGAAKLMKIKKVCKQKFGNDPEKYKNCVKTLKKKHATPAGMIKKTKAESKIEEFVPAAPIAAVTSVAVIIRKKCKKRFPNDPAKYKECLKSLARKVKSEGTIGDIKSSMKKDKEIAKSDMTPAQKKLAWAKHLIQMCKTHASRKNWSPEKLQKCIASAKAKAK